MITTTDLLQLPLFAGIEPDLVNYVAPLFTRAAFPTATTLFTQNTPADWVYLLEAGEVELKFHPEDGGWVTIATLEAGNVLGWSAVLGHPCYTSSAFATTPVQALVIAGAHLRKVLRAQPQLIVLLNRMANSVAQRGNPARLDLTRWLAEQVGR